MTEQQQHLSNVTQQQKTLIEEMQSLERDLNQKREIALKLQGVIEYLTQLGITLPVEEVSKEQSEEASEVLEENSEA
jgi:type II secretory pathway component PulJ